MRNVKVYDVSNTHPSVLVAEAFRCSHLVFASTTYNAGIFVNMETLLHDIVAHNLQNRTVALIENGTWAPTAGGLMRKLLSGLRGIDILEDSLTVRSSLKEDQLEALDRMAAAIAASVRPEAARRAERKADRAERHVQALLRSVRADARRTIATAAASSTPSTRSPIRPSASPSP